MMTNHVTLKLSKLIKERLAPHPQMQIQNLVIHLIIKGDLRYRMLRKILKMACKLPIKKRERQPNKETLVMFIQTRMSKNRLMTAKRTNLGNQGSRGEYQDNHLSLVLMTTLLTVETL